MKLNEKEAVHCRTQEEFDKAVKELEKQGHKWFAKFDGRFNQYRDKIGLSFLSTENIKTIQHMETLVFLRN